MIPPADTGPRFGSYRLTFHTPKDGKKKTALQKENLVRQLARNVQIFLDHYRDDSYTTELRHEEGTGRSVLLAKADSKEGNELIRENLLLDFSEIVEAQIRLFGMTSEEGSRLYGLLRRLKESTLKQLASRIPEPPNSEIELDIEV